MNPTIVIVMLLAMLVLSFHFDRRRRERDSRAEDSSVAAGFKRWLMGSHDANVVEMPHPMEKVPKTRLRVRGSLPPESWSTLATALLASLPSDAPVNAAVDASFAIDANQAPAVINNLNSLISELELSGLNVARIDPPQKFINRGW